jgi:hypothetical protein
MRPRSESSAIESLAAVREDFRKVISSRYEQRAKRCDECKNPGICCTDRHFVNVEISRLEAAAIDRAIKELNTELQQRIFMRVKREAESLSLRRDGKYSCPLFEPGIGCTVHNTAKPLPCIFHSCYERREDLPPDELLDLAEEKVVILNRRVYLQMPKYLPIPVALLDRFQAAADQ